MCSASASKLHRHPRQHGYPTARPGWPIRMGCGPPWSTVVPHFKEVASNSTGWGGPSSNEYCLGARSFLIGAGFLVGQRTKNDKLEAKRKRHSGEICQVATATRWYRKCSFIKNEWLVPSGNSSHAFSSPRPWQKSGLDHNQWVHGVLTQDKPQVARKKRPHPICLTWATAFDSRPSHPGSRWKFAKNCCAASDTSLLHGCSSGQWHVGSMLIDKFICNRLRTGRKNPRESRDASSIKAASKQHVHLFQSSLRNLRYPKLICVILTKCCSLRSLSHPTALESPGAPWSPGALWTLGTWTEGRWSSLGPGGNWMGHPARPRVFTEFWKARMKSETPTPQTLFKGNKLPGATKKNTRCSEI